MVAVEGSASPAAMKAAAPFKRACLVGDSERLGSLSQPLGLGFEYIAFSDSIPAFSRPVVDVELLAMSSCG
jgi:hypothetical protein